MGIGVVQSGISRRLFWLVKDELEKKRKSLKKVVFNSCVMTVGRSVTTNKALIVKYWFAKD